MSEQYFELELEIYMCCLMKPGHSNAIWVSGMTILDSMFAKKKKNPHQIRYQVTSKIGSQPADCRWLL